MQNDTVCYLWSLNNRERHERSNAVLARKRREGGGAVAGELCTGDGVGEAFALGASNRRLASVDSSTDEA